MKFKPSPNQEAIFRFIEEEKGSAVIEAVAGSGKTTTIVKALELIDPSKKILFLAFNKKIATELQSRIPAHAKAATFHSVGYGAWRFATDNCQIDDAKLSNLLKTHFSELHRSSYGAAMRKLVGLAKSAGVGKLIANDMVNWYALADHHSVELPDSPKFADQAIQLSMQLLELSVEAARAGTIDFDDMLYMPLLDNVPFSKYDYVFVDEAQDTNQVQLSLLRRMLKPGGRLIAVGDRHQAIYGFRGADAGAMDAIVEAFGCKILPLSKSYRCAKNVIKLAQTIVPHIEAADNAPDGEIIDDVPFSDTNFANEDVIICRNTAPLIETAFRFISQGRGCKVLGRDIGSGLISLVEKMKGDDIAEFERRLEAFTQREVEKHMGKGEEDRAEAVRDRSNCLTAIISHLPENNRTIPALKVTIAEMFSDDASKSMLTLCTAHKSKGLEWDRVFILRSDLMPSKWARQRWQQEQEKNLMYVAYTRAKKTLVFLRVEIDGNKTSNHAPSPATKADSHFPFASASETNRERAIRRWMSIGAPEGKLNPLWIEV